MGDDSRLIQFFIYLGWFPTNTIIFIRRDSRRIMTTFKKYLENYKFKQGLICQFGFLPNDYHNSHGGLSQQITINHDKSWQINLSSISMGDKFFTSHFDTKDFYEPVHFKLLLCLAATI